MFKALKTIKKIKQLQKEMHDVSLAFLALQDVGLMPEDERSKAKAQTMHDVSHMLKDVLGGKSVDEAMKRLNSEAKIEEVEQEDDKD
ncbi:phage protein [Streptococcus pneumoniae GA44500]|nr:phage protein [Streptococcus pneumoniae GA44500]